MKDAKTIEHGDICITYNGRDATLRTLANLIGTDTATAAIFVTEMATKNKEENRT